MLLDKLWKGRVGVGGAAGRASRECFGTERGPGSGHAALGLMTGLVTRCSSWTIDKTSHSNYEMRGVKAGR